MPDYKQGKIYKIVDANEEMVYVGSTTDTLSRRMVGHRVQYKARRINYSVFDIFDKYGIENCKILLIELCPCDTKDELTRREGEFIKALTCVNKNVAGRTRKAYRQDYKEEIKEEQKAYRQTHKEEARAYYLANRDKRKEQTRARYAAAKASAQANEMINYKDN